MCYNFSIAGQACILSVDGNRTSSIAGGIFFLTTSCTKRINVAIDGPAGAGKSTIARLVARELGYIYVDTGAMYRAVTLCMIRAGLKADQEDAVGDLAEKLEIQLRTGTDGQIVLADGRDVTREIRTTEVAQLVPAVAKIERVRRLMVVKQRTMAAEGGVVMDGRDIGSKVLPDAEVKIFLTASLEERARRRYEELKQADADVTYERVLRDLAERDEIDRTRKVSPLVVAEDAYVLDTSDLTIPEVVEIIVARCRKAMEQGAVR
jgi:cytidylate kinase